MQAARRWGVIWPAALAGLVGGSAAGFAAAPDVIAVPALFALSGLCSGCYWACWPCGDARQSRPRRRSTSIGTSPSNRRRRRWHRRRRAATRPPAGIPIRITAPPGATGTATPGPSTCGMAASRDEGR